MADWLSLLDSDPDTVWAQAGKAAADPLGKARKKIEEGISRTMDQIIAGEDKPKRGWYVVKGDRARVTIKAGNKIIPVQNRDYNTVPKERAKDFYQGALFAVREGKLDTAIAATILGKEAAPAGEAKPKRKRAGWSPERRAAAAAKRAAKAK